MHRTKILASAVLFAAASHGIALPADAIPAAVMERNGIFTDASGRTLYISDDDKRANVSACYGNCGHNWPAFGAADDAHDVGSWKIMIRDDGTRQWAYKGKPVYYFILDLAAGDRKGDGVANVWHIAKP